MSPFVHLHVHTHYSLLDGANKVPELVKQAKTLGMEALAITDHGCMFGVIEFYNECHKQGIKPILGMEAYIAPGDRRERSTPGGNAGEAAFHLLLLAQNLAGYQNLLKLASIAYREGFYYKPRIDKQVLRELNGGLIATSACLGGEIPSAILRHDKAGARRITESYLDIFGPDRFFIEVQKQGIAEQDTANPELADLAKRLGCGLVATNDVHFLRRQDHHAHDVLCCISMGRLITDENRLKYPAELYLKSPQEMQQALGAYPEALANTAAIAAQCELKLDFGKLHAPVYKVPVEKLPAPTPQDAGQGDDERYLRRLCEEGLAWRYGTTDVAPEIRARLEHELKIITHKGFCSYFLIVWDFCNYARSQNIPVGARGSAVGTMVGYLLGLCNVDPLRYGLLFERFMDPSRSELPDIDIDICQDGRARVIEYVRQKYGHVAQIITFGTLAAKAACKDVGRVLGVPLAEVDKLTKLIPNSPAMTLDKALEHSPDLQKLYHENPTITQVIDTARSLEGLCRNAGCHAAGVIIADQPLENLVPLYRDSEGTILTQFDGPVVDKAGLLKMDFLGLRTLTTLHRSIELVKQNQGVDIDIEKLDFADQKVFELFRQGRTKGIFQFESGGMQDLLMKMRPDRIEDLIAANALYRPGPMELIPVYCQRKHGREAIPSVHPIMDAILKETYGVMVYQEQVMQIFNQLGGIELANAYKLIKAISKKTVEVIAKFQPQFLKGCVERGISQAKAQELFELILKFGGYGFNKSHSTRYAIVAYQTAHMKVYHPVQYMAALLTYEVDKPEKVVEYIDECRRIALPDGTRGIRVLPPDVNESDKDFTPLAAPTPAPAPKARKSHAKAAAGHVTPIQPTIRFGMMAVRGVGEKAVEAILQERQRGGPFQGLYDFCERVDLRQVTRTTIEALVKCGAFCFGGVRRSQLLAALDRAVEVGHQTQQDKRMGQMNIFGGDSSASAVKLPSVALPELAELEPAELLKFEKELLGFYVTSHPLSEHQLALERFSGAGTRDPLRLPEGMEVVMGGMVGRVSRKVAKSGRSAGQPWAVVTLEDLDGQIDAMVFADALADITRKCPDALSPEKVVFLKGKIDKRRQTPCLIVSDAIPIEQAPARLTTSILLLLEPQRHQPPVLAELKPLLARHRGHTPVFAKVVLPDSATESALLRLPSEYSLRPSPAMMEELELLLGPGAVQLHGAGSKRVRQLKQQRLFGDDTPAEPPQATETEPPLETDVD